MKPDNDKNSSFRALGNLDRIIHEPARLLILACLYVVESADFLFLMNQTELTKGNLSSHLSKLEAAGYVDIEKKFIDKIPRTILSLSAKGRQSFKAYKDNLSQAFNDIPD